MKKYTLLIFVITGILLALSLASCGKPEHVHRPSQWITEEESTCSSFGYQYRECLDCGVIVEENVIYTYGDHVEMPVQGYPSTCTGEGLTDGTVCAECGVTIVEQRRIPTVGHSYTLTSTKEPTCTTEGYKTYTCQCGVSYEEIYANALQHDGSVLDDYVPPTCTEEGYSMGYHCSRCGEVTIPQTVIEPLGHYPVTDYAVSPKCTESGLTEGSHCARCELVFVPQTVIPAKGHTIRIDEGSEPTCEWDGYTESQFCTTCYKTVVEAVTIPATGHTYIKYEVTEPTCYLGGYTTRTCHCGYYEKCDEVDALGHDEVIDPAIESTCTVSGRTEGSHCSRCDKPLKYYTILPILHHDITTVQVDPTLDADGSITDTCSRCDYVKVTPIVLNDYILPGNYWSMFLDHTDSYGDHYVVPEMFEVDGQWYKVVGISKNGLSRDWKLASIVLPDTITSIADSAFLYCHSLRSVTLPSNLVSIGDSAFYDCEKLVDIELPDSLVSIGAHAFWDCQSLTEIHLGTSLTEIGEGAFSSCKSITSLTVPGNLKVVGAYAFSDLNYVKEIIICEGVERIEEWAFSYYTDVTRLVLPDSLRYVGANAFYSSLFISVEIGAGDVVFDDNAFSSCESLTTLVIREGEKVFSPTAFTECTFLNVIYDYSDNGVTFDNPIAESVKVIIRDSTPIYKDDGYSYTYTSDNFLFRYDGEKHQLIAYGGIEDTVTLPETFGGLAYDIYRMSGVLHAILPNNITEIPANAFCDYDGIRYVTIPDGVLEIGDYAFYRTGLREIILPDSVEVIGYYSFGRCGKVKAITLSESLRVIGERAFMESGNYDQIPVHVTIPDSVESIGTYAFLHFTSLGTVSIGSGLKEFGYCVFTFYDELYISEDNEHFTAIDGHIYTKDMKTFIHYKHISGYIADSYTILDGVTTIADGAFYGASVYQIIIPDTVTQIGAYAFYGCRYLTSITIPDSVEYIDDSAFEGCVDMDTVILGKGVKEIGERGFWNSDITFYYKGTYAEWEQIDIYGRNSTPFNRTVTYFYLELAPTVPTNNWHYDSEGNPVLW